MSKKNINKELYPREYRIWKAMKARCYAPCINNGIYKKANIQVCERWKHSFDNFINDMGKAPTGYSIDRINNLGDYCPENCRWANNSEQAKNKSSTKIYLINGELKCLKDIARDYNIKYTTLYNRIFRNGFSITEAIDPNFEQISRDKRNLTSKYIGVAYHKKKKKWQAHVYEHGKQIFLGSYETEDEAHNIIEEYKRSKINEKN